MIEQTVEFQEGLKKGLRASADNARNNQALYICQGAYPEDDILRAYQDIRPYQIDTADLGAVFPFPQIFILNQLTLVCDIDTIYEYKNYTFEVILLNVPAGSTWSVADYGDFIILTNGNCLVVRDAATKAFAVYNVCDIPQCVCLCDLNGQLIVGAPGTNVAVGFTK